MTSLLHKFVYAPYPQLYYITKAQKLTIKDKPTKGRGDHESLIALMSHADQTKVSHAAIEVVALTCAA